MYALVLGLLLVLGLSGDTSGMCGESRQQIESHIGSSEGLSHRCENSALTAVLAAARGSCRTIINIVFKFGLLARANSIGLGRTPLQNF